ncbi:hypothetical protein ANN_17748 [Periplaneta americana]|uniref:Uncharacterized protein n=1 Tax=Periplaneta americana TaxID=6978 RepID=A0ABQ8SUE3_PERAM|nr:hypothetical protein ANN_17748 [Periplaneta americana]
MASVSDVSDFCASKSEFVPSEDSLSDSYNEVQTKKRKRNPMKWASNAKNQTETMAWLILPRQENLFPPVLQDFRVRDGNTELLVCKTAFCSLHGIDKSRVERLAKHLALNLTSPPDLRGKHGNRPHAVSENCIAQVDQYIRSFPRRKSHYSRTDNVKMYYLAADLNVKKMYHLYMQKHEPKEYLKLQSGLAIKPNISYDFYYRYFVSNFNMSYGKPRTDTCQTCDQVDKNIMYAESEEEKRKIKNRIRAPSAEGSSGLYFTERKVETS